jgi:2-amino-4-hydroxy-6-hydroxymethyldihydropteridine diphosphokinase
MPAYIALGSNMGDPSRNVARALRALEGLSATPVLKSSLWLTKPVGCPPGSPDFDNATALIEPLKYENPESLLANLLELEIGFGRLPKQIDNEPRPLDLDLIAYNEEIRDTTELTLPHPRWHQRRFVLEPLNEIAPLAILPGQKHTVAHLLSITEVCGKMLRL